MMPRWPKTERISLVKIRRASVGTGRWEDVRAGGGTTGESTTPAGLRRSGPWPPPRGRCRRRSRARTVPGPPFLAAQGPPREELARHVPDGAAAARRLVARHLAALADPPADVEALLLQVRVPGRLEPLGRLAAGLADQHGDRDVPPLRGSRPLRRPDLHRPLELAGLLRGMRQDLGLEGPGGLALGLADDLGDPGSSPLKARLTRSRPLIAIAGRDMGRKKTNQ